MSRHVATTITAVAIAAILISGGTAASAPGQAPPVNQTPPSITGAAQVGSTLTGSPGTWSGKTLSYAYQWVRCSSSGASCSAIGGATASTDSLTSADAGSTLRVTVTATNRNGSAVATSAQTAVVASASSPPPPTPPSSTSLPTISGTAQQGQTLTTTNGTWTGSPTSYTYDWTRCDTAGTNCAVISGTKAASYTLTSADVNHTLRAYVNATNSAGTGTALSAATGVVTATTGTSTDTSAIDDEGTIRMGTSPTSMTNGNKFGTLAFGGYYNIFQPLPGRAIKYTIGSFCMTDDVVESPATCRANGWLVHNSSGQEITYYGGLPLTNLGNASFQNDLKQRILDFLALHPWIDGVYFDDGALSVGQFGASYPVYDQNNNLLWSSDSDYQRAQISFLSNVAAALKARGYAVGVNARGYIAGDNRSNTGALAKWWMNRYAPYVTAAMIEYWHQGQSACCGSHAVDLSGNDTWYNHWDGWQSAESYAQSKGLEFWPADYIAKTGEDSQCRYLRGSYLLDWNGTGSIMLMSWDGTDFWNSCTATDVGFPTGAKYQPVAGVWERQYTRGYVIVNPTHSTVTVGSDTIPSGDAILHQN